MPKNQSQPAKPAVSQADKSAQRLAKLGLHTDIDLVLHLPLRYEDETSIMPLAEALASSANIVQIEAQVVSAEVIIKPRRQLTVTLCDRDDPSMPSITLRFLHFFGYQLQQFSPGAWVRARGEIKSGFFGAEIVHPSYKIIRPGTPLPTVLTPVYPAAAGISQAFLRTAINAAMARIDWRDTLPQELCERFDLIGFAEAIRYLHHPPQAANPDELIERSHPAWVRVKFDELLAQQLSMRRARLARRAQGAPALSPPGALSQALHNALPFVLTGAQQRVLAEICADMQCAHPMQRLLQGDVGSGKTVVAALAAALALDNGYQAALMAPTEILADQHFRKIAAWLEPLGVSVAWLTGSLKKKAKQQTYAQIESGAAQLIIGTHALLQEQVQFAKLGLVIVDEQHRFGVGQRLTLRQKSGKLAPHQLMMSATPIPRTLAMTYYADLEVSAIDELPPGRTPIVTRLIDQQRREQVIERLALAAAEGRQAYWVCPLIEESEALQLQTATETHAMLTQALPQLQIGLIHGRLKPQEKQAVMDGFSRGEIDVLVATTVIEVGVDVPNASLMVIEHAERFGLAQLHQLRGRVGRGSAASICLLLFQGPLGGIARQRLTAMRDSNDGFMLARRDLELRGPGEFLGARQSGLAMLRFADLNQDQWLVEKARVVAQILAQEHPAAANAHLARWLGMRQEYLKV